MAEPIRPDIFINYRAGDGEQAAALIERDLSRRFGSERVFRAGKSIRPGEDYRHVLSAASSAARVLLAIIGPKWLSLDGDNGTSGLHDEENWTRKEILNAFDHRAHVIPIILGRERKYLSTMKLPAELAQLANVQAIALDINDPEPGLTKIAKILVELVPGLTDRTVERSADAGHTRNQLSGTVSGVSIQAQDFQQSGGAIGRTVINTVHGPVQTGGPQYNDFSRPVFHGDGTTYIAGKNTGDIHQTFGRTSGEDNTQ